MCHPPVDLHPHIRDIAELVRAVLAGPDGLREVFAHLRLVNLESARELDVGDVVSAQVHMHQAGNEFIRLRVAVEMHPLHE